VHTPHESDGPCGNDSRLISGHMPRGVLVDRKAEVQQEYYAGVVWAGPRKRPEMIFSSVGGIDIEQVVEEQPDKVGRRSILEDRAVERVRGLDRLDRRDG
jgi:succinyl-CoA synthetase beta subunit